MTLGQLTSLDLIRGFVAVGRRMCMTSPPADSSILRLRGPANLCVMSVAGTNRPANVLGAG
jgi:hypothetical protein